MTAVLKSYIELDHQSGTDTVQHALRKSTAKPDFSPPY